MRAFFWVLALLIILIFISPFYSLYKIGTGIKDKDVNTLNAYIVWNEIQDSVKYDVSEYLKNREELRKKDLDNPIDGVFEDIRKIDPKAICSFMHTVKSRESIREAYFKYIGL